MINNYYEMYLKYKSKYLDINTQYGGNNIMNYHNGLNLYKNVLIDSNKLEQVYDIFWKNIYYNDAYIFYKNAIDYYKNNYNDNNHNSFSRIINKKLYTGSCQYIDPEKRNQFINSIHIDKVDLDDLCNLSVQIINILDTVFTICPKIPFNITVYRTEVRHINDEIFKIKKNDYYKNIAYMSTTINPFLYFTKDLEYNIKLNHKIISMTILLPYNTNAYYMISPYGVTLDRILNKHIGFQEYEILLQRDNIFQVMETQNIGGIFFITMKLVSQIMIKNNITSETIKIYDSSIINKKEFDELITRNKYYKIICNDNIINNYRINIYKEYLKLNRKEIKYTKFIFDKIISIRSKYLLEWCKHKPIYNSKKYPKIKKEEFDDIYNKFINILSKKKIINKIYINCSVKYFYGDNFLYKKLSNDNIEGKIIKINLPVIFNKKLSNSILSENTNFICYTEGTNVKEFSNYYKIDNNYPHIIIVEYNHKISYLPISYDEGITFDVKQIKIDKINKTYITDNIFYYLIETS